VQRLDGYTSGWSFPNNEEEVFTPGEMVVPVLLARMEERGGKTRVGIGCLYSGCFMAVAALAGEGEVHKNGQAATTFRKDMFDGKRVR
jgi:hypothetical protein